MKKILLALLLVTGFMMEQSNAQVRIGVNLNIGSQPDWGPVGYDYAGYYYFPDIDVYYDVATRQFIYFDGYQWVYSYDLPSEYGDFDLYGAYKVVINEPRPYLRADFYRTQYYKYRGYHGQQILRDRRGYRDNDDRRVYQQGNDNRYNNRQVYEQRNNNYDNHQAYNNRREENNRQWNNNAPVNRSWNGNTNNAPVNNTPINRQWNGNGNNQPVNNNRQWNGNGNGTERRQNIVPQQQQSQPQPQQQNDRWSQRRSEQPQANSNQNNNSNNRGNWNQGEGHRRH